MIGTGIMGAGHARFLRTNVPGADVFAITDIDESRAHTLIDDLGGNINFCGSVTELLALEELDGVIIASPDSLHVQHLRLAIERKIPTLCEKPIATNYISVRSSTDRASDYGSEG
jgi:myo-inositol 2-dehydrogenase / D-chiro-inositol 1-dehydrogenase